MSPRRSPTAPCRPILPRRHDSPQGAASVIILQSPRGHARRPPGRIGLLQGEGMLDLLPRHVVRKLSGGVPPAVAFLPRTARDLYVSAGSLEVRLAASAAEIRRAQ